jgi:hypothetical protein
MRFLLVLLALSSCIAPPSHAPGPLDVVIDAGSARGDGVPDRFGLVRHGDVVEVDVDGAPARSFPWAALGTLTIEGSGDDDMLVVDLDGGNPVPSGGLVYHGGDNRTARGDTLELEGGAASTATYAAVGRNDGVVVVDDARITFTGLEPLVDTSPATNYTFIAPPGTHAIRYVPGENGLARIEGDGFELIELSNKTHVTIEAGPDTTSVLIDPVTPDGLVDLTVNTQSGDDEISINRFPLPISVNTGEGDDFVKVAPGAGSVTIDGGSQVIGDHVLVVVDGKPKVGPSTVTAPGFGDVTCTGVELLEAVPATKAGKLLKQRSRL